MRIYSVLKPAALIFTCLLFLSSCIVIGTPTAIPEKHPFREEALDFLTIGEATKSDVSKHFESAETDRRIVGPTSYRDDSVWAFSATREMWQWWWCGGAGAGYYAAADCGITDRDSQTYQLLIYFDSNDVVVGFDILPENECVKGGFCSSGARLVVATRPFQEGGHGLYVERPKVEDVVSILGKPEQEYVDGGDKAYFYNNPQNVLLEPLLRQYKASGFSGGDFSIGITFDSGGYIKRIQEFDNNQCYQTGFCVVAGGRLVPIPQNSIIDNIKRFVDEETTGESSKTYGIPVFSYSHERKEEFVFLSPERLLLTTRLGLRSRHVVLELNQNGTITDSDWLRPGICRERYGFCSTLVGKLMIYADQDTDAAARTFSAPKSGCSLFLYTSSHVWKIVDINLDGQSLGALLKGDGFFRVEVAVGAHRLDFELKDVGHDPYGLIRAQATHEFECEAGSMQFAYLKQTWPWFGDTAKLEVTLQSMADAKAQLENKRLAMHLDRVIFINPTLSSDNPVSQLH